MILLLINSIFINSHYAGYYWVPRLGGRIILQEGSSEQFIYNLGLTYIFETLDLKLKANVASAFKTPTLYQQFGPYRGDNLKPEESVSYELSAHYVNLSQSIDLQGTVFFTEYQNIIGFNSLSSQYTNQENIQSYGMDIFQKYRIASWVNFLWNSQIIKSYNQLTKVKQFYIPDFKNNFSLSYLLPRQLLFSLELISMGKRLDYSGEVLDVRHNFNISLTKQFNPQMKLKVSVKNLVSRHNTEVVGYNTEGRVFSVNFTNVY